MKHERQIPK